MKQRSFTRLFLFIIMSTLFMLSASAVDTVYICDNGSDSAAGTAAAPVQTTARAAELLGGTGRIVLCGDLTLPADTVLSASGALTFTADGDAELCIAGNLYLDCDVTFEKMSLYFRKSNAKIFCCGHNLTVASTAANRYVGTAPAIYGGSYAGRAGESADSLVFRDFAVHVGGGTWSALTGGSFRNGEEQPVGTVSGICLTVNGGTFVGEATASSDAVISITGFDALEGDGSLLITGGSFSCGIFGVGRPGYNSTVSNNQHIEGDLSITVTGGSFTGGRIAALQDAVASRLDGDFTLTVQGGSFAADFGGFDGTGTQGIALSDLKRTYFALPSVGFDDLLYLSANGTGDGRTADAPSASVKPRGGKLVICGAADAAQIDLSAQEKPLTVTGGTLRFDGTLCATAPLTFYDMTLSGTGTLSGGGYDLTLGTGIVGGAELALLGGGMAESDSYVLRVQSGTFRCVTGGQCAADAAVSVVIEGGTVLGDVICGEGGNASLLVTGGVVQGNLYAFATYGGRGGIAVFGGCVTGNAATAKSPRDAYAVRRFGCYGLPQSAVHTEGAITVYAGGKTVFVCDGGTGNGASPLSPLGTLAEAITAAEGGEVVLCGPVTVSGALTLPTVTGETRITSVFCGVSFADVCDAALLLNGGIHCTGETLIYDLPIRIYNNSTYIAAEGYPLTLGEGLICTLMPGRRLEKYPTVTGGSYGLTKILHRSPCLTVKSGTYGVVSGGSYHPTASVSGRIVLGDIDLTVFGGTICTRLLVVGNNSLNGSARATLYGGVLDCPVFALADGTSARGDITLALAGVTVCGEIDRAIGSGATHNGTYTLELRGGNLDRLGKIGARTVSGQASTVLRVAETVKLNAAIEGTMTYQNPIAGYADPSVVYSDGWYYYSFAKDYAGKPGLCIAKAANLSDIDDVEPTVVWAQALSDDATDVISLWAPQLYQLDGTWYIYTTCDVGKTSTAGARRIPLIWKSSTASPEGPYTYVDTLNNLDGDVESYLSPRIISYGSRTYMVCGGFWRMEDRDGQHIQRLFIGELSDPITLKDKMHLISSPSYDFEKNIMEGPFPLVSQNGVLYLAYAAGHTRTDEYCTGLLRFTGGENDLLTDASLWYKYDTPLQFTDYASGVYSPGAMIFVPAPDGAILAVYHAKEYHYSAYTMRRMYMQTVTFDQTGKPVVSAPPSTDTELTVALNPMPLADRITGFAAPEACVPAATRFAEADARLVSGLSRGDTDLDGAATLRDVARTLSYLGGAAQADFDPVHADLDRDGKVTVDDALQILKEVVDRK